jgi:glycosyltransferase involved in cell wall biosynthesis
MSVTNQGPAPEVTLVMPCLNEARTLADCITEALEAMRGARIEGEVLVADNGSTDGSQEIATRHGARVVPVAAKGYGNALRGGIAAARGRFIVMGDADGSYCFAHIPRLVDRLRAGADLVMGNRFLGGVQPGAMPWKNRYLGNPTLSFIGRLFFRTSIGDFHCGLRGFTADAYRRMDLRTTGMELASEMVIKAVLFGMRVEEVPTILRPDGRDRPPHLRPWRDGWRHLRFMLLFSPRWLFFYPGVALMIAGLAGVIALLPGPLELGRITLDVHTMLFAALAVVVGFQAVSFAALGKFFAIRAGLRQSEERFAANLKFFTLEAGLVTGALLVLAGLGLWVGAVGIWGGQSFGPLNPAQTLRWVIPGALCLLLGGQLILTSFLLGVLRLDTRSDAA